MEAKAKHVTDIVIHDPDLGGDVVISIFKHENGGMFGVDSSYIDQVTPEDSEGNPVVNDPLSLPDQYRVILEYPKE
jgi:hypothetical protein